VYRFAAVGTVYGIRQTNLRGLASSGFGCGWLKRFNSRDKTCADVGCAGQRGIGDLKLVSGEGVEGEVEVEEVDAGFAKEAELALGRVLVDEVGQGRF
jgi:hypothetical protein